MVRGERITTRRVLLVFLLSATFGCDVARRPAIMRPAAPQVTRTRAMCLVIRTNILPDKKAFLHLVIIGEGKARVGNELDRWRLFDLQNNTVTFVDDIARTYRTETLASLLRQKRALLRQAMPEFVPVANFQPTEHERTFGPFPARLAVIRLGAFQRSLWMSTTLDVPPQLFDLIVASDPLTTPYSPAMAQVFEGMLRLDGFPVLDRSDITFGEKTHTIEKKLERVEYRRVPTAWLQIPAGYQDLAPQRPEDSRRSLVPEALRRRVSTVLPGDRRPVE